MRDLEKDQKRLDELWNSECIDDPNELMEIASHAVSAAQKAEEEVDQLKHEMRMFQDHFNRRSRV